VKTRYRIVQYIETRTRKEDKNPFCRDTTGSAIVVEEVRPDGEQGWIFEVPAQMAGLFSPIVCDGEGNPVGAEFEVESIQVNIPAEEAVA
jgi:hypothetical protein